MAAKTQTTMKPTAGVSVAGRETQAVILRRVGIGRLSFLAVRGSGWGRFLCLTLLALGLCSPCAGGENTRPGWDSQVIIEEAAEGNPAFGAEQSQGSGAARSVLPPRRLADRQRHRGASAEYDWSGRPRSRYTSAPIPTPAAERAEIIAEDGDTDDFLPPRHGVRMAQRPFGDWYPRDSGDFCPLWVQGDFLLWWLHGFSVPALVTTGPASAARDVAGVLGQPGTSVLLGNGTLIDEAAPGLRLRAGYWLGPCQIHGIEATYLRLASADSQYAAASSGNPILGRPFYNVETGAYVQDAELIAFPGVLQGNVSVSAQTDFEALEVLYRRALVRECCDRVDFVAGWRFQRLRDQLVIRDSKKVVGEDTGLVVGTTLQESDWFETRNLFNGAEVGILAERRWGDWSLELAAKMALGSTHSRVTIDGSTTATVPVSNGVPSVAVTQAGLLAQQTNIGTYEHDYFAVAPEIGIRVGYNITRDLRATAGYTLLYWNTVARPGDQIDSSLNLSQLNEDGLVGAARPRFSWLATDMWVQGFTVGLDYRF